jgi:hypothetical protein
MFVSSGSSEHKVDKQGVPGSVDDFVIEICHV